ncbi:RGS13 [Acrasis kona]|uniref:RGS13 n=1 Tax=Acrasis kona TaxID=1008807 RepID=A0AAW2YMK4_9EUKA
MPTNYDIMFDNVFVDNRLQRCFHDHLKKNHNQEALQFLTDVGEYLTLVGESSKYNAAKFIMLEYFDANSPSEVNVSCSQKASLNEEFKKCSANHCPNTLFDDVRLAVYVGLKEDCFGSFVSSKDFGKHVKDTLKTDPNYLSHVGSLKRGRYILKDLAKSKVLSVTDIDFECALTNLKCDWNTVFSNHNYSIQLSKQKSSSGFKKRKEVMTLPFSAQEAYNIIVCGETRKQIQDSLCRSEKMLQAVDCGKYKAVTVHCVQKTSFPLKNRDASLLCCSKRLQDGSIIHFEKSVRNPNVPLTKNVIRTSTLMTQLFEDVEGGCRFTSVTDFDFGGSLNPALLNLSMSFVRTVLNVILEAGRKRKELGISGPDHSLLMSCCLAHYDGSHVKNFSCC